MAHSLTSDVVVIGAGLAGCCTAYALARRGFTVTLIEATSGPAQKASGNRFGLLTPYITTSASPLETLYSAGFHHSRALLVDLQETRRLFHQVGALQLPATDRLRTSLSSSSPLLGGMELRRVSNSDASDISGVRIDRPCFYSPQAGFVSPRELLELLLHIQRDKIRCYYNESVCSLERSGREWRALCPSGLRIASQSVVLCTAYEAARLSPASWLPLEPVRGQTVTITSTPYSMALRTILAFGGYLTPSVQGTHFLGAHYRHHDNDPTPRSEDTDQILATCRTFFPDFAFESSLTFEARVCFRTSTIDRLPYIGALPDFETMQHEVLALRSGSAIESRVPLRPLEGVFVNLGHGSRGLLSCPLGGEVIARLIAGEPLGEYEAAAKIVDPSRLPYRLLPRLQADKN
jgi:tRNA 5-methylaminomethyl-2-thiouridine biosynthesis bifunctional protein